MVSFRPGESAQKEGHMNKCECRDCGKVFNKGDEGDNEEFCLRCERQSLTEGMDDAEYEELDRRESGL